MDQEESIRLIEFYKTYQFLWNAKEKAYHSRNKREDAWRAMSIKMNRPVATLKAKMKTLMGSYRSEKSREKKSRITGSGSEDIYESKWFAYKYFDFLSDKDEPRETVDTESEVLLQPDTKVSVELSQPSTSSASTSLNISTTQSVNDNVTTPSIKRRKTGAKQKTSNEQNSDAVLISEALQILQSSTTNSNDPYFAYAIHLANELKKYDQHTLAHVKRAFANILFEADMGTLSATTSNYGSRASSEYMPQTSCSTPSSLQSASLHGAHGALTTVQLESGSNSLVDNALPSSRNYEEEVLDQHSSEDIDVSPFFINI